MSDLDCVICRGAAADDELGRVQVWDDRHWRLTMSLESETPGFSYLEPKRHIPFVSDLDREEAKGFGGVLAHVTRVLRSVTETEVVYIYIFGDGVPHFHVHLAPHRAGDALSSQFIRGELIEEKMPNGFTRVFSKQFPPLSRDELLDVSFRARKCFEASITNI
jgi:diadenosine tetraphosphate (Ap4A) HIT family hydrolase